MKQRKKEVYTKSVELDNYKKLKEIIDSKIFESIFNGVLDTNKKYNKSYYEEILNKMKEQKELSQGEKEDFFEILDQIVNKSAERIYENINKGYNNLNLENIIQRLATFLGYIKIEREINIDWKQFYEVSKKDKHWEIKYGVVKSWEKEKLEEKCIFDKIWEMKHIQDNVYYSARIGNTWYIVEYWKEGDILKSELQINKNLFWQLINITIISKPDELWRIWQWIFIGFEEKEKKKKDKIQFKEIGDVTPYRNWYHYYAWMKWNKWIIVKNWKEEDYCKLEKNEEILKTDIDGVMLLLKVNNQWWIKYGLIKSWEKDKAEKKCIFDDILDTKIINWELYYTCWIIDKLWEIRYGLMKYGEENKAKDKCISDWTGYIVEKWWNAYCVFRIGNKKWIMKYGEENKAKDKCIFDEIWTGEVINWKLYYTCWIIDKLWKIRYGLMKYGEENKAEKKCIFDKILDTKIINWKLYYQWEIEWKYCWIKYGEENKAKDKCISK